MSQPSSWEDVPAGTLAVLLIDPAKPPLVLFNAATYEVGDGDLVVTSRRGNVLRIRAGAWMGIGTVEHDPELGAWIAMETHAA